MYYNNVISCNNVNVACNVYFCNKGDYIARTMKKLVPWGTDGRLPLIGDFRSLIIE